MISTVSTNYYAGNFTVPSSTPIGTTLTNSASILPFTGYVDNNLSNNNDVATSTVTGSFDPNDKSVTPRGNGPTGAVHHNTRLYYHINFQNTGTASAINVKVQDVINSGLDMKSLIMGRASHLYIMKAIGNTITWTFPNINLPDSNTNEPLSHGFIEFSIMPLQGQADGTIIENSADIYFDFNSPFATNTVTNTLQTTITTTTEENNALYLTTFPAPVTENLFIRSSIAGDLIIELYDITGRKINTIYQGNYSHETISYNMHSLSSGTYFIKLYSTGFTENRKILKQ